MGERNDGAWFAPKRFGIGANRPIAWQGWLLLLSHTTVMLGGALLLRPNEVAQLAWIVTFALLPMPLYAAKTRGGWRWRWNRRD